MLLLVIWILKVLKKYLVSCSDDKTLKIWDLNTYEYIKTLNGHTDDVCSIENKNME